MAIEKSTGKRKRIAKPQEERESDILDAAATIFSRDGVANAKIENITALANVSKGTFYLYFKSKEDAAAAVWRRYIDEFIQIGESILSDDTLSIGPRLVKVFESLLQFILSNAALHRNLYQAAGSEAVKRAANERLIALIGAAARQGVARGELHCAHPELVVSTLYHGFCSSTIEAISSKAPPQTCGPTEYGVLARSDRVQCERLLFCE